MANPWIPATLQTPDTNIWNQPSYIPPTTGDHQWWDGTNLYDATLEGWWDGTAVQPVTLVGWWDGTAVQAVAPAS